MIVWPITQHRTESSAGGTGALADACLDCLTGVPSPISETTATVDSTAARPRRSNLPVLAWLAVAGCAATIGWLGTGLLAAIPAGAGLAALAGSDLATHRFSLSGAAH